MSLIDTLKRGKARRTRHQLIIYITLILLLLAGFFTSLMAGDRFYYLDEVLTVLRGETVVSVSNANYIIGELRLPRALLAIIAGFSFGLAGVSFQTMLRNQLASPDIIGISAGASAGGVIGIVLLSWSQTPVSILALCCSLGDALLIYLLSLKGGFTGSRFILIGIGISSMLMSVVTYVLSRAAQWDVGTAMRWLTGSLNDTHWDRIIPLMISFTIIVPIILLFTRKLEMLRFGDDTATSLGINTTVTRITIILGAVALIAITTAACGPISFVAFMSGPIAARICRPGAPLSFAAGLIGALLVLIADFIGQYALGTRYPVGVITGMLGAPFLVYLLARAQRTGTRL